MIWSSFLAPIAIMSGAPPGAKGLPAVVLRGSVRLVACAATRLRPFTSEELAPDTSQCLARAAPALETRRQQRTQRRRFRRDPASYLAKLEADLLQLILPPYWVFPRLVDTRSPLPSGLAEGTMKTAEAARASLQSSLQFSIVHI